MISCISSLFKEPKPCIRSRESETKSLRFLKTPLFSGISVIFAESCAFNLATQPVSPGDCAEVSAGGARVKRCRIKGSEIPQPQWLRLGAELHVSLLSVADKKTFQIRPQVSRLKAKISSVEQYLSRMKEQILQELSNMGTIRLQGDGSYDQEGNQDRLYVALLDEIGATDQGQAGDVGLSSVLPDASKVTVTSRAALFEDPKKDCQRSS